LSPIYANPIRIWRGAFSAPCVRYNEAIVMAFLMRRCKHSMAVHYYDEDDIEVDKVAGCYVVVNHVVELSEQERSLVRSY